MKHLIIIGKFHICYHFFPFLMVIYTQMKPFYYVSCPRLYANFIISTLLDCDWSSRVVIHNNLREVFICVYTMTV